MTVKARYTNEAATAVTVTLDEDDTLGNFHGKADEVVEFSLSMPSPGNKEYEALVKLIDDGEIEIDEHVAPKAAIAVISDRQFFSQLALQGVITEFEAEATANGTLPKALEDAVNLISDSTERFLTRMAVKNATTFDRHSPFVPAIQAALKWSDEQLDQLWINAAKL